MKRVFFLVFFLIFFNIFSPVAAYSVSPSPPIPTISPLNLNTAVNVVMIRLKAAFLRLGNINQRMNSRLEKIKTMQVNVTKLTSQSASISERIVKLQGKMNQVEGQITVLSTGSASPSAYRLFQQETTELNQTLKTILSDEKNILIQIKRLRIPAATVSATAVPKK